MFGSKVGEPKETNEDQDETPAYGKHNKKSR